MRRKKGNWYIYAPLAEKTQMPFLLNVLLIHTKAGTDNCTCVFK